MLPKAMYTDCFRAEENSSVRGTVTTNEPIMSPNS